jgi:anion-transporting  ArsA/GET3 family ATPase
LIGFLDSRLVQVLLHPAFEGARFGFRLWGRGLHQVFRVLERVSGFSFLEDVSEFLLAFEGMSEGFRERARQVRALLFGPQTAFVLVAGPADESVAHAVQFLERLESSGARVEGLVLNRIRVWPDGRPCEPKPEQQAEARAILAEALAADADPGFPAEEAAEAALCILHGYASMVRRDERATGALIDRARRSGFFVRRVPEFERDVHDLDGLARIERFVFEEVPGSES